MLCIIRLFRSIIGIVSEKAVLYPLQKVLFSFFAVLESLLEFIQLNIHLVLVACASLGGFLFLTYRKTAVEGKAVTPAQATMLINRENAVIIDVRSSDEYVSGHLPESRNIPEERFEERAAELEKLKDTPVIFVCQSGTRAAAVCNRLEKEGFAKVHALGGGISGWSASGLPLKKGAKK